MSSPSSIRYNYAPTRNPVGLVALILVLVGTVATLGVFAVPFLLFVAIPLLVVAFILAIIGLTRRDQKKWTSIWALVLSIIFGILGPILFAGSFLNFVGNEVGGVAVSGSPADDAIVARIGEAVTNESGMTITVTGTECGIAEIENNYTVTEQASSQFCTVSFSVLNGTSEPSGVHASEVTSLIGDASYDASPMVGGVLPLNPGLEGSGLVAFDVPADATLDYFEFKPHMSTSGDAILVKLK